MKTFVKWAGLLLWLQAVAVVAAVSESSINELMQLSGITKQVDYYPAMIKAGLDESRQQGGAIPEREYEAILRAVQRSVKPAEINSGIRFALQTSLNDADVEHLLGWYRSAAGRAVTAAEEQGATPEAYARMLADSESLLADQSRLAFARRLDSILGLTDFTLAIQESTSIAVYAGVLAVVQPQVPLNMVELKQQVRATLEQNRSAIEQMVLISTVYSYKSIDLDTLRDYEAFLRDPRTETFNRKVIAGLGAGLENAVANLGLVLGQELVHGQ